MSEQLGLKIKRLREDAKITLEELASIAGISPSQMQTIESGGMVPSMPVLVKLARGLKVRLGTILDGQEHDGPVMADEQSHRPVISLSNDNTEARKHLNFYSLAQQKTDRNMDPLMVSVGYAENTPANFSHHEGEEFLYVLEGEVELRYGAQSYPLKAGESIYYDSLVPHCVTTLSPDAPAARMLAITYTPY